LKRSKGPRLEHVSRMQERREREHSEENEDCSVKKQRADCLEVEIVPLDFINAVDAAVALAAAQKVKPRALALLGVRGLQLRTNFLKETHTCKKFKQTRFFFEKKNVSFVFCSESGVRS
jgi:hypothetical protein